MKFQITVVALLLIFSTLSIASSDQERAALANLLTELDVLAEIVDEAESCSDTNDRRPFDYSALRRDFQQVREGVSDYLNAIRREPRELPPITGEYLD